MMYTYGTDTYLQGGINLGLCWDQEDDTLFSPEPMQHFIWITIAYCWSIFYPEKNVVMGCSASLIFLFIAILYLELSL